MQPTDAPYVRTGEPTMTLPDGVTCNTCAWMSRCVWLVGRRGNETECDFDPSRYTPVAAPPGGERQP